MQPQSPNPDFNFMFQNEQPSKRGLGMPGLPKWAKIGLAVVAGLIILIIISSLLSGHKSGGAKSLAGVMARNAETLRVTALAQQLQLQDPQTQALAATVTSSLSSDQAQFAGYLATNHIKLSKLQLAGDLDKTTDSSLQTASQNNNLDSAYVAYLKDALPKYRADLQAAYNSSGPNGKQILQAGFESSSTLLSAPPLKS